MELYVHIPFCVKKCDYCDFLSFPADPEVQKRYVGALLEELRACAQECAGEEVSSVFVGGGTPSVLAEGLILSVMEVIRREFTLAGDCEVSLEANPGTLSAGKLAEYLGSGINRLSIGCQSVLDGELAALGRIHTFAQFREQYAMAREIGFDNINVDLMSAIPGQSTESWEKNLRTIARLGPEHISAYSLIVEEGTPFSLRELELPSEEEERRMYEMTGEILGEYGYHRYEISNYAREGRECRHNIGYWRRADYLGTGLGAASLRRGKRFSNTRDLSDYLQNAAYPERIRRDIQILSAQEEMEEFMFLGLRMTEGISTVDFRNLFRIDIGDVYGAQIRKLEGLGLLERQGGRLCLTEPGISLSNQVFVEFLF